MTVEVDTVACILPPGRVVKRQFTHTRQRPSRKLLDFLVPLGGMKRMRYLLWLLSLLHLLRVATAFSEGTRLLAA